MIVALIGFSSCSYNAYYKGKSLNDGTISLIYAEIPTGIHPIYAVGDTIYVNQEGLIDPIDTTKTDKFIIVKNVK